MKADERFLKQPKSFWANVRTISEQVGYVERVQRRRNSTAERVLGPVKVPTLDEIQVKFRQLALRTDHIADTSTGQVTEFGRTLFDYYTHRAAVLNTYVEPRLMDVERARAEFERLKTTFRPPEKLPMNKQKNEKKDVAFFTAIIQTLVGAYAQGLPFNPNPLVFTTVTRENTPLRTFARRVDGAFTSTVNPIAIWEIKEYYYTETFGSRVADGMYETLLDGMELEELHEHEAIHVKHYLMVDGHTCWWRDGRPFLCRMIDMLHMGYADEVLFGFEVLERLPDIVSGWVQAAREHPELISTKGQGVEAAELQDTLPGFD